ncbi:MAG TPA: hypothetical protein VFV43_06765 [Limnobacter sp.]|nr:hypothetical protein [Limnobacter sp.]
MSAFLNVVHRALAKFYMTAFAVFEHGWFEAIGHSRQPNSTPECPAQQIRRAFVQPLSGMTSND